MKRSSDRILTTHVGSLIPPPALQEFLRVRQGSKPYDEAGYGRCSEREGVAATADLVSAGPIINTG